jgi:hypothetical protein
MTADLPTTFLLCLALAAFLEAVLWGLGPDAEEVI